MKPELKDKSEGELLIGTTKNNEVVLNWDQATRNSVEEIAKWLEGQGGKTYATFLRSLVGHVKFSPNQARHFGMLLIKKATEAEIKAGCPWLKWENKPGSREYAHQLKEWLDAEFAPAQHEVVSDDGEWFYARPEGGFDEQD